jgi:hypothetical protein
MRSAFAYFLLVVILASCNNGGAPASLEVNEQSIDRYVEEKLDTSQNYEIITGLRFSKDENTYSAVEFSQNDTAILCTEEITTADGGTIYRNIFFKDDLPVYVEEYETIMGDEAMVYRQRRVYFNGAIVLKAYEKTAASEEELVQVPFKETTMTMNMFDFNRAKQSVRQRGEYEMKFGEFLVFDLQAYLVLENEESGYSVAIYILKGDGLVDALYADPAAYQGKTIHVYHEFMNIGGLDQMVYMGGYIVN